MTGKTAVQEIEGRIELLGKQIADANREAGEYRGLANARMDAAEAMTTLRNEYIGLLEDSGAGPTTQQISIHAATPDPAELAAIVQRRINHHAIY